MCSWLLPSHGWLPALTYTRTCTCIPVVLHFLSHVPVCCLCICFPGCRGGEGREEGLGLGEGLGRKEEDMSVGESIKSTLHVDVEFLQK